MEKKEEKKDVNVQGAEGIAEGFTVINKEELEQLRESAENAENYKKWWLAKDHEVDKMNLRIKELEDGLEKAGDIIKMLLMNEL